MQVFKNHWNEKPIVYNSNELIDTCMVQCTPTVYSVTIYICMVQTKYYDILFNIALSRLEDSFGSCYD